MNLKLKRKVDAVQSKPKEVLYLRMDPDLRYHVEQLAHLSKVSLNTMALMLIEIGLEEATKED